MQVMEVPIKTDFSHSTQSSLSTHLKLSTVSTLCAKQFQWPHFQFHCYWTPTKSLFNRGCGALVLYTTLHNLHINFHTVNMVFHPVLVCGGRNAVMCGNSSCFGTIALGSLGKLFPHKLCVSVLQGESLIVSACKHLND